MVPRALPPSPAEDPTQAQPCTLSSAGRAEWLSPRRGVGVGALGESSRPRAESPRHSLLGSPSEAGSRCAGGVTDGHVPSGRSKSSACSQGFICHWKAATGCTSGHLATVTPAVQASSTHPCPIPGAPGPSPRASARCSLLGPPGSPRPRWPGRLTAHGQRWEEDEHLWDTFLPGAARLPRLPPPSRRLLKWDF